MLKFAIRDTDLYIPIDTAQWIRDYFAVPDMHRSVGRADLLCRPSKDLSKITFSFLLDVSYQGHCCDKSWQQLGNQDSTRSRYVVGSCKFRSATGSRANTRAAINTYFAIDEPRGAYSIQLHPEFTILTGR
jgi:hypothetical protein